MKNLIFGTLLFVGFTLLSCAQKSKTETVPEKVKAAMDAKFSDAEEVEWEMESENEWEAEFEMGEKEYSAIFNTEGEWKETEYEINAADLATDIRAILDQNFTAYKIEKAEIAETAAGKSYEFEIEVGGEEFEVVIDAQGKLTKKAKSEEDEEDEDNEKD